MKRFAGLIALLCLALAVPAHAQLACTEPDLLALVFDSGYINHTPTAGAPFNMHVQLLNPTGQPVDGFEFTLVMPTTPGTLFVLQESFPGLAINVGSVSGNNREYAVGFASPLPATNNRIRLMTLNLMSLSSIPNLDFYVRPTSVPSIQGHIAYNENAGANAYLHAMTPVSGSFTLPVARLYPTTPLYYCQGGPELNQLAVDIATASGGIGDPLARAGTAGLATDGFDIAYERPEPALPPSNYVCTSFEHAEWPLGPRFDNDIRAPFDPTTQARTWPLMVETDRDDLVTLSFTPNFDETDGIHLALRDLSTQLMLPIFPHLDYSYRNHGQPTARRFQLMMGAATVPALSPTAHSVIPGWTLVSLPLVPAPAGNTLGQILLDAPNGYRFAYTYDQVVGYVPATSSQTATIGTGYWLGTTDSFTWSTNGTKPLDGTEITTRPGWNLIGYPNWTYGAVTGLIVKHGGEYLSWLGAAQAGLVSPDPQGYDRVTGGYFDVTNMFPFQAYWVNVLSPDVTLLVYWRNFAGAAKDLQAVATDAPGSWRANLSLVDAAGSERTVTLGVDLAATEGFDAMFDRPQPPAPPAPGPLFYLLHPEWHLAAGNRFTRDIVGPAPDPLSWTLNLTSPNAGPATLRWDTGDWPADLDLQLYLPAENRVLVGSMRKQSSAAVTLGGNPVAVVVRSPDQASGVGDLPLASAGRLTVHPNPFNPQATFSFALPRAAVAEVRIYSLRGELVRALGAGMLGAGPHQLAWDGADRSGRDVPSGSYFGRLHIDGQPEGGIVRMSLVR